MKFRLGILGGCIVIVGFVGCSSPKEVVINEKEYIYDYIKRCIGNSSVQVYYCIKDLAEDGKPELILSVNNGKEYTPFIIYAYDGAKIEWACISGEYIMSIYKDGVIEYISGGVQTHFMYYQMIKDTNSIQYLTTIAVEKVGHRQVYYKEIEDGKHEEITEEDFFNIKNQYATVAEELEWKKLEGFWSPDDIK